MGVRSINGLLWPFIEWENNYRKLKHAAAWFIIRYGTETWNAYCVQYWPRFSIHARRKIMSRLHPVMCTVWGYCELLLWSDKGQWLPSQWGRWSLWMLNWILKSHTNTFCWINSSVSYHISVHLGWDVRNALNIYCFWCFELNEHLCTFRELVGHHGVLMIWQHRLFSAVTRKQPNCE